MVSLVLVGCALCASYTLDPKTEKVRGREPITSVERLSCFLKGASGIHGVARARRALRQVADGAESPQEINMFLMMSLQPALGGRGIDGLKLNYVIDVKDTDAGIVDRADRRFARIDMGVPDQNAGAEYLGKHHERQVDADRNRLIFLLAKGERVLQAKYADLSDPVKANRLANQLERILGRGSDEPTPSEMLAREKLSNTLFGAGRMQI
ncbi:MAG: hypothetical protein IJ781_09155 [Atopobiaceae bacterium]|nr:hypothetical protein [Atopobiaceae bacterium]